ncbi:uncharacterized protein LOC110450628 [Mizuhopecten yessoensis]|uniref:uncharacterized protein LOC110450628 n=1 Tax=Mizuhopecten yessoensis TaxID=6573 RepID=UPI000B45E633|nr:uncharacterized protein LOC110450628 [Mizuhopecten yessoensis]
MELKSVLTVTLYLIYAANADHVTYKKVCYYTNWSQYRDDVGKFLPKDIDPFLCTHVIYAFAKLSGNRIVPQEWNDETVPWKKGLYEQVTDLKKINPNLKVLLSVGGWSAGGKNFSDMAATEAGRKEFASSTVTFLRKRFFDGVDIDWEFPGSLTRSGGSKDKDNLSLLLKEVSTVFNREVRNPARKRLLLSIAVPASQDKIDQGYKVSDVSLYCDMINVMTYNYHGMWENTVGHHSALFKRNDTTGYQSKLNMAWTINYWIRKGAQANKLIVGFAQYGRGFTLTDPNKKAPGDPSSGGSVSGSSTKETGFLAYYEICKMLKSGAVVTWDDVQKVPHLVLGNQWVGFDNERSIKEKVKWLKNDRFGGIMVWALPLDDFTGKHCAQGETYPILRSIIRELNRPDRATEQLPISSDGLPPASSQQIIPDQVQSDAVVTTDTMQGVPLVSLSSSKAIVRLENAKDQSGPVVTVKEQNKQLIEAIASPRKTGTKPTTVMSDPIKEVLSDVIVNPDKVSAMKVKSSDQKQLLKTSSMKNEPLVNVAASKIKNHKKTPKTDGKAQKGPIVHAASAQVETIVKSKPAIDAKVPIATATILSDSLTKNNQDQSGVIGKAKVLNEVELTQDKSKATPNAKKTKITDTGKTDPLVKTVVKASPTILQADNKKIVGTNLKKTVTKMKTSAHTKSGNDTDFGTRLSSAIVTKGTASKKIGNSVFTEGQPVYSAPDVNDLRLTSRDSGAAGLAEKKTVLTDLKDKKQTQPIIQKDVSAIKVATNEMNDATTTKDQSKELHNTSGIESAMKTTKDSIDLTASGKIQIEKKKAKQIMSSSSTKLPNDQTGTNRESKTHSEPGKGKEKVSSVITVKPPVNAGENNSKFTSRKLLQMSDNEGMNGGGLGNMISSLFGMMSGFTSGGNGRQPAQEPRDELFPTASTVTEIPPSFNAGSNDNNRLSRQRQRFLNDRRERQPNSRDRPAIATNNRERSTNSLALDRARNTRDRSLARNGRERLGVAVDRSSNIRNRSNQPPVDTLTDVSPLPPTANPFDSIDILDPRDRGGIFSPLMGGRNVEIQERLRGRQVEDTRTARERFLDAMILAEQLPDPRPIDSQNGIRSRDQIRDPALIRSREPGLVETLRRRMSDAGRSRGNTGVATNIQTPERGRGRVLADTRQSIGVNSRNSNLRRNIAGTDRQRSVIGIQSQGRDRQRNAVGVGPSRRRNNAVGVQDIGNERQRPSIGVQNVGNDRQRTSVGVQSTGTGTDRRTRTGVQSTAASRQRTMIGVQGLGQRTAIGVQNTDRQRSLNGQGTGNDRQRSTVGISLQNGRGGRQRPAIGVQGPSNDRQRTGTGIQNSDRQRTAVGIQGSTNDRQRTAVGIPGSTNDRQRTAIGVTNVGRQRTSLGVQRSGNDRQRTSIGVQSLTNDRSRPAVGVTNAGRQRSAIGVQRSGNDRQRTSIGVQSSTNDRSRQAVGVTNADRQRTAIDVQRSGNDRQRTSVGVEGSTDERQRVTVGVQNAERQRTAIGVQRVGNDRQRTSVGVDGSTAERQRTAVGFQNGDRQRTAIGVQRVGNDRQRTSVGVDGSTAERQRTAVGVQNADRQRTAVGIQRVGNDRQRTSVEVRGGTNDLQRTAVGVTNAGRQRTSIGVQRSGNERQRSSVGIQGPVTDRQIPPIGVQNIDRQRSAIGVQRSGNDRQRLSVGVEGSTADRQRPSIGVQNADRQRTAIGVQRSGNDRQRTTIGVEGLTNERQRMAIGVANVDRQRTAIGVQRSGNERQQSSVGIQGSVTDRQRPSIGVQNIDLQRTAIGVQRTGSDRQRTVIGVEASPDERRRTAVGVSNADRQRTAIDVQLSGIEGLRTSVGIQGMLSDRQRPAFGIQNADRQRTATGVQRSGNDRQRTSVGIQGSTNDRRRIAVGVQNADRQKTAIGVQRVGNNRQGTTFDINDLQRKIINVQGSNNDRQRTAIGVQRSGNDIQRNNVEGQSPVISFQRTAIGIQAAGDINQRPIINTGGAISKSRRTVATNSVNRELTERQAPPVSTERRTIAVNTISGNQSGSLNSITGTTSPESNRIMGISGNSWQTGPQTVAIQERGTRPVSLITQLNNRNAFENSIGELLAQINAQQLSTTMENTVSITPLDPMFDSSIRVVPLNNIDNSLLNNMPQGPPIQILNNTEILPSAIAVTSNVNSIEGSNTFDLLNSLAANRMSMPDSPMANSLTAEQILAAMAVAQSRPAKDVVNEPIVLEIQPQILPTEPPLSKDITDALVQLLRENLLNQNTPPQTTPVPFKQDAMQTPNQVLVSTGEQPKEFPPLLPSPRRQTSSLATNATVVANINQPKGLTKADVLWKWEA